MKKFIGLLILSLAVSNKCLAGQFSAAGITFEIPKGFEGPASQSFENGMSYGFVKPSSTLKVRTLLQLSTHDLGKYVSKNSNQEQFVDSDKCLFEFLKGVERRRTGFNQSEIIHILLAGSPASKITWHGSIEGYKTNGVMYCTIIDRNAISFHVQDAGSEITPNMLEAIISVESLNLATKN